VGAGGFTLLDGGRYVCTPAWSMSRPESHRYLRLYVVLSGAAECSLGGRWASLRPGRIYLIPPVERAWRRCPRRMDVDWLHALPDSPVLELRLAAIGALVDWPLSAWRGWKDSLGALRHGVPTDLETQLRLEALVAAMAAAALARHRVAEPEPRFAPLVRWLDQHAVRNPSLDECARVAGLSPIHFHRAFTRAVGLTPHAYVQRRRLRYAQELLRGSALPIAEIATRCGFADPFYFSRVFRQAFGMAPRDARVRPSP
jgi:AraC-like DNA-binding protein